MRIRNRRFFPVATAGAFCLLALSASTCAAQQGNAIGVGNWLTFTANIPEAGYRRTDFFEPGYNTSVFQWDSRVELWLPPHRRKFSWGLYLKVAGIAESQTAAYPNAWLGGPGAGFQIFPLSTWRFQEQSSTMGKLFGPLRFFAEYSRTEFLGAENTWRPRSQSQVGFDYWKAVNVNDPDRGWWVEVWNGCYWLSSNEFTDRYDTVQLANSWRSGMRVPRRGVISSITPYVVIESSRTKYDRAGTQNCVFASPTAGTNPCDFYWENGLILGGGIRYAPSLAKVTFKDKVTHKDKAWLNRFVVYGEYLNTATYYGPAAPSSIPRYDIRVGVSASIGQWYK